MVHAEGLGRLGEAVAVGCRWAPCGRSEQKPRVGAGLALATVARCPALWSRRCGALARGSTVEVRIKPRKTKWSSAKKFAAKCR